MIKRLQFRFGIRRRRAVTNQLIRQREEQDEAKREYERQAELRSQEWVPVITEDDAEILRKWRIRWV